MFAIRWAAAAVVCWAAVGLAGCNRGPKMAPVVGKVSYPDGSPATAGKIVLIPDDPLIPSAVAEFGPDGQYSVYTVKPGDGGAQLGSYRLIVQPPGEDYGPKKPRPIDVKYADPATSGFTVTVEDKTNTLDLVVTRPGQPAAKN